MRESLTDPELARVAKNHIIVFTWFKEDAGMIEGLISALRIRNPAIKIVILTDEPIRVQQGIADLVLNKCSFTLGAIDAISFRGALNRMLDTTSLESR